MNKTMNKLLFSTAFLIGAIAIIWIGGVFLGHSALGLAVTLIIAAVYLIGFLELLRFRSATLSLSKALSVLTEPIDVLEQWLQSIDVQLRDAVRIRATGGRNPLPGPLLTPYLVGLLVMLGLLGTFVGMVDTLKGAVVALEGTSELEAIRRGLAAPIEGLGLAFGTSVAGVAASAMLGLLSALSRRERIHVSRSLDQKTSQELSSHSPVHQQILAFKAIQGQTQALPKVAEQLGELAENLSKFGQEIGDKLSAQQLEYHQKISELQSASIDSLNGSLETSLGQSVEAISKQLNTTSEAALTQLNENALATQTSLQSVVSEQITGMRDLSEAQYKSSNELCESLVQSQQNSIESIVSSTGESVTKLVEQMQTNVSALSANFEQTSQGWEKQQTKQAERITKAMQSEMQSWRDKESANVESAVSKISEMDAVVADHLTQMGLKLEEPITRLIDVASQSPQAAADLIAQLRDEVSKNVERENLMLEERAQLMSHLNEVSDRLATNSADQREAIELLVSKSTTTLSRIGDAFNEQVGKESQKISDTADQFASSTADMASWGEAFQLAMQQFSESNSHLVENLNRIESALAENNARSDEQLAYYVAQAREIIDHNLLSHQQIIAALNTKDPVQMAVKEVSQ